MEAESVSFPIVCYSSSERRGFPSSHRCFKKRNNEL